MNIFINNFLPEIIGAFIGSIAAIFVFYCTVKYDRKRENRIELNFQNEKLQLFSSMIEDVIENLKKQIEYIDLFCNDLSMKTFELPLMKFTIHKSLERINLFLNSDNYFHAYLSNLPDKQKSRKEFMNICNLLDYFNKQCNQISEMLEIAKKFDYERKIKYKQIVDNTMDFVVKLYQNAKINKRLDNFYLCLNSVIVDFYQNRNQNIELEYYQKSFVETLKKELFNFLDDERSDEILISLKNATFLFSEINLQNINLNKDFISIKEQLKKSVQELETISKRLIDKYRCN